MIITSSVLNFVDLAGSEKAPADIGYELYHKIIFILINCIQFILQFSVLTINS